MNAAELRNVTKSYGSIRALDGVSFHMREGEVLAVLGPNGAGKTTSVRMMMGLARPDRGTATLFGRDPRRAAVRRACGVMLQTSGVPATLKVAEHLRLFASYYPAPLPVERAIALAGLEGLEERTVGRLSGGQRQRLMFALAIVGDPAVLFLDEPTVGLDVTARRRLWETIRDLADRGRTILLTTHYLEEADSLADRVVLLHRGRVVADDSPDQIKARVPSRRVACRTRVPASVIGQWPGVQRARRNGAGTEIYCAKAEPVVRRLLGEDESLEGLEVGSAGLEAAFLQLTDQDEREAP